MNAIRTLGASVALLACALASSAAHAQGASHKAAAEALFEEGRKLMAEGKVESACPKFADSQQLDPSSATLLNLANCYEKQGRTASAWATYKEAASLANANGRTDHLTVAQKRAEALGSKLSRVTVQVAAPADGLEIKRDGATVTRAEWGLPIPVDPGGHTYEVTAPGKKPWSTSIRVAADASTTTLSVPALESQPVAVTPAPPPATDTTPAPITAAPQQPIPQDHADDAPQTQRTAGAIVAAFGVVGLGVGAVFAVSAKSKYDTSLDSCPNGKDLCSAAGVQQRDDARTAGNISTIAMTVGAVAVAGGAVLWLTAPKSSSSSSGAEKIAARLGIAPTLGGAMIRGQW
jgi:hypothetical protein